MVESGVNPESLATVVKEMKKENFSIGGSQNENTYVNLFFLKFH